MRGDLFSLLLRMVVRRSGFSSFVCSCCVTLGRSLGLSAMQFPLLQKEGDVCIGLKIRETRLPFRITWAHFWQPDSLPGQLHGNPWEGPKVMPLSVGGLGIWSGRPSLPPSADVCGRSLSGLGPMGRGHVRLLLTICPPLCSPQILLLTQRQMCLSLKPLRVKTAHSVSHPASVGVWTSAP